MSDQTTEARILLTAEDRASTVVKNFRSQLDAAIKSVERLVSLKMPAGITGARQSNTARGAFDSFKAGAEAARRLGDIEARNSRQRRADASAEAKGRRMFDRADVAAIRQRMAFQARMTRQRIAEIRQVEREQARADARAERDATALGRRRVAEESRVRQARERARRDVFVQGRGAFARGRDAARELVRPPAALAAAGAAVSGAGARRILRAEGDVDSSEINARIYGGLSKDAARKLRDQWAAPLAEALGSQTDKLLDAYTEATKVGIPAAGAQAFAELATKTSEAWAVPFETVTDTLGTVNSILTSKGAAFDGGKLKSVANTLQHLAAKQSTTPEKLISFLQRGAGGADVLGMSMESALAFGSASTSLGNQAGQSGSLLDYIASRVVEMPKLTRQHGQEGKQARELVQVLGYGSAQAMDAKRRANPDAFLPDLMERFNRIRDPKKQEQAIRFFTGREWLGEFGRMVKGIDTYREAVKLAREAKGLDAIGAVWELHRTKLAFVFKQFRAGWLNILGEFGKVLSPMARQAGDVFLAWTSKLRAGGLADRFKASLDGFLDGLGFRDLPDMLKRVLGEPGQGGAGAVATWRATFREFGAGIADVVGSIKSVIGAFTGGDPEVIARWTGRILALSVALVALSPALGILRGLVSGITAIVSAVTGVGTALKLAGIGGAAFWTTAGGLVAAGFLAAVANKLGILKAPDVSQGWGRGILEFLDPGLASRIYGDRKPETGQGSTWGDPPARVRRQSSSSDWRGLVSPAAFNPAEEIARNTRHLVQTVSGGARVQLAGFGGLVGFGGLAAPGNATAGGGSGSPGHAGMQVPGWYGRGSNRFGGGAGGGVTDPRMSSDVVERAKAAHDFFRSKGLSEEATAGILASMKQESNFTPNARGDGGRAHGLFQHHADRRAQIRAATGIDMSNASFQQQLEGAWWEMNHGDAGAQRALKILRRPGITAREAGGAFVQHFERPARDERGERGALAEGMLRQFGGSDGQASGASGGAADAVDVAGKYLGMNEHRDRGALSRFVGHDVAGNLNAWCARFVNASLNAVGVKGTGSAMATSFLKWGKAVDAEAVQKGDVLVEHRGKAAGQGGGHVGLATGRTRPNPETGELELESVSGNHGDSVVTDWTPARKVAVRRSLDAMVKQGLSASGAASTAAPRPTAADLAGQADQSPRPVRVIGADGKATGTGNTTTVHAPVTINGAQQSPQELAGHLQRHVAEFRGFRAHDMEPELA